MANQLFPNKISRDDINPYTGEPYTDVPAAVAVDEVDIQAVIASLNSGKVSTNSFPDHRGRPGQVGGSLPRAAGGPTAGAKEILNLLRTQGGGFSYKPQDESAPQSGYMSSIDDGPVFSPDLPDAESLVLIDKFLADKADVLSGEPVYVGGWLNEKDGMFYLDASENFKGLDDAMQSAAATHQKGIFNLNEFDTIWVGDWLEKNPDFDAPPGAREWYIANPEPT